MATRETLDEIRAKVRDRFARVAATPAQEQKFPVGPRSAKGLGYDSSAIDRLPESVTESFAGVGNPLSPGEIRPGETVLDLGSRAGLDSFLAAVREGSTGFDRDTLRGNETVVSSSCVIPET